MLLISQDDIEKVYNINDAIDSDRKAFILFSQGKTEVPLRTNVQVKKHNGVLLFMPAYAEELDVASLKIINLYPQNKEKGIETSPSQILIIDTKTGKIEAMIDGNYCTKLRTGAASGLALDVFGRKDAAIGALIGTGGQAKTQLQAMLAVRNLEEVRICSRKFENAKKFVDDMIEEIELGSTRLIPVESSDEAIADADLIITATPSHEPVFDGNKVKQGATISCVGSYQPDMQEMPKEILNRASKIYFDSREAVLSEAGDILQPLAGNVITCDDFTGDIGEVLLGRVKGREHADEIIVFKSVGIGAQDLTTAMYIYEKAKKAKVGLVWNE